MARIEGRRIAVLCTEGVEQVELTRPWQALEDAGAVPVLVSLDDGEVQAFHHLDRGDRFEVNEVVSEVSAGDFDGLFLPGGVASPDRLRTDADAVRFTRDFFTGRKPVAAICHGPWLLVEAGVLAGRTITSWPSLRTDVENAGGTWVDEPLVRDGGLVTSREPGDLDAFCPAIVELFEAQPPPAGAGATGDRVTEASQESFPASDPPGYGP